MLIRRVLKKIIVKIFDIVYFCCASLIVLLVNTYKPKNTIIFLMVHKTLSDRHIKNTINSLISQHEFNHLSIKKLIIYNTNQIEISNERILGYLNMFSNELRNITVECFEFEGPIPKSLTADIRTIRNFCMKHYSFNAGILLLKCDTILSKKYLKDLKMRTKSTLYYYVPPFVLSKQSVTDLELFDYACQNDFKLSDHQTFFLESSNRHVPSDLETKREVQLEDDRIKFVSCTVIWDFSCHYFTNILFPLVRIRERDWGGVSFERLAMYHTENRESFCLHQYHDIVSENRSTPRDSMEYLER